MSKDSKLNLDLKRYESPNDMPKFQKWMRKYQDSNNLFMKKIYKMLFIWHKSRHCIEISENTKIGGGLYIGHSYCITIVIFIKMLQLVKKVVGKGRGVRQ